MMQTTVNVGDHPQRSRVAFVLGLCLVLLALLLVSAGGEPRHENGGRPDPALVAHGHWLELALAVSDELSLEHRDAWRRLAPEHARLLLSVNATAMGQPGNVVTPMPGAEVVRP